MAEETEGFMTLIIFYEVSYQRFSCVRSLPQWPNQLEPKLKKHVKEGKLFQILTTTLKAAPIMRPKLCATSTVYSEITKNMRNLTMSSGCADIVYTITENIAHATI